MSKKYVIRFANGTESASLTTDEVINRIRKKEIVALDEVAVLPGRLFMPIRSMTEFEDAFAEVFEEFSGEEKTLISDKNKLRMDPDREITKVTREIKNPIAVDDNAPKEVTPLAEHEEWVDDSTKRQKTAVMERPIELLSKDEPARKRKFNLPSKRIIVLIAFLFVAYEYLYEDDEDNAETPIHIVMRPVRPELPGGGTGKVDPEASMKYYDSVLKYYMEDTVRGYRKAVEGFQIALRADPQNVKALAMLASSYINLIDSSNKDENTFTVINKLIELSRSKDVALVETLIAEVEFFGISRRYDAAIQRLNEYYKVAGKIDPILYYYLGWFYTLKHEYANAMKYLNLIPASALPMPKLYYLRGYLHEENKEYDEARSEYTRALKLNPKHAKSILGLVRVSEKTGELKNMVRYVEFLTSQPSLQSPAEYVNALIYSSKLALLYKKPELAMKSLEEAIRIEPRNEDLKLEYYTLMAGADQNSSYKKMAKMYALILEGERLIHEQKFHEASTIFLQAKDAFPKSEVPLEKMGDLFFEIGQFQKARLNYEKALEMNPKSGEIAVKFIDALISNHDYEDAQKYLAKYRDHPKLKSSIDRLAGNLAYQQGYYEQAIHFYRKSMARDTIDTDVYASYADALREMDQCKDAQFFYTLSQRLDPFNHSAIMGSAKCLLKSDGINAAVGRVQEELSRMLKASPDLLSGIATIYYMNSDFDRALQFTAQAHELDPDYPDAYKIEGDIYLKMMISKKEMKKKALESLKAYSDRKVSDPYGFIQRFEIFLKDSNFDLANAELNRVFEVSPRYPELHFRRAQLLSKMGRSKEAIAELEEELKFNPRFVPAFVTLGNTHVQLKNLDEAMGYYLKAMDLDPQNAQAKMGAGYVNYLRRQFSSAIALYQAALAIDKGNPEIYKKLGMVYRDSGDPQKAAQAFRSYLDLAPDAPDRADYDQYR